MFTSRMKMADIVAENYYVILALSRLGIPLGFGEKSVKEVCHAAGVPVDFMLLICNLITYSEYQPDIEAIAATDMSMLIPYLQNSHRYYTDDCLPHIGNHINHIADRIEERYSRTLKSFYGDFRSEITAHFRHEEKTVFPRLVALQNGDEVRGASRPHSEKFHTSLVDKLNDLTQIIYKYLPGNVLPVETMELVFDILQLSSDIQKHTLIEDKILQPYTMWLERRRG